MTFFYANRMRFRFRNENSRLAGFGLIGLIVAVVVIAGLAGLGWYWQKTKERALQIPPAPQPSQQPDTSGWKTYRNEKYGFEMRYPNDWSFAGGAPIKNPGDDYFSIRYKSQEAYCSEGLGCVYPGVITIEPRKDLTLKQFKERLTSGGKYSIKEFKVFEHPAVKLIPIKLEGVALEQFNRGIAPSEVIFVELNPSTVLQIWVYTFLQDRSSILGTVDTMLSTFKFFK